MNKKQSWNITLLFLILVFGFAIASFIKPEQEFSEKENRVLAEKPEFSIESLLEGSYTADYETYLTDQFLLRNSWVGLKTAVERLTLKQEVNGIYFARDGYLIESHRDSFSTDTAEANIHTLGTFAQKALGMYGSDHVSVMVVPNAVEVLKEKLPPYAPRGTEAEYLTRVKEALPEGVWFDAGEVLYRHRDEYIFYRTDHHWTTLGAYHVYAEWARSMGIEPLAEEDYEIREVTDSFLGTVESKVNTAAEADTIQIFLPKKKVATELSYNRSEEKKTSPYDYTKLVDKDKYAVFYGGNQGLIACSTGVKNGRRLLVIKDSYANCFVPFTYTEFAQVDMVDLRYFNESLSDFMENGNYTDVLFLYNASGFAEDPNVYRLQS